MYRRLGGVGRPAIDYAAAQSCVRYFQNQLTEIFPTEQLEQRFGKCFQALGDILTGFELAGGDPGGNLADGLRVSGGIVEHDHPLHTCPVDQEREIVARSFDRRRVVVLGDGAAYDDAGMPGPIA
jgi:hypothetical protein